jgi:hypothetical protein
MDEWSCLMTLICISLMAKMSHNFFCAFLLLGYPLKWDVCIFCSFSNGIVYFLLLSFKIFLCILDTKTLLDTQFADIFSLSKACFCFFHPLSRLFPREKVTLDEFQFTNFPLIDFVFGVTDKWRSPSSKFWRFSLMFIPRSFIFLHFTLEFVRDVY